MLKLYGYPISNYYNMVKCALIEKGVEFEEVPTRPAQEADYLAKSPMGKIPCLETGAGCLSESIAMLDYLEEAYPEHPLLPADTFARAKVRELVLNLELNIELVARKGYDVLRGKDTPEAAKESIKADLPRGARAIAGIAKFSPWIAGSEFTYADLVGYFTFIYAARSAEANAQIDLYKEIPGLKEWYDQVGERESVKKALADQAA
ncbi:MAG: glutathione S-transferase family protein [Pseudomonadales bacterium]